MNEFRYTLYSDGSVKQAGYDNHENSLSGDEPFSSVEIFDYRKNLSTGEWVKIKTAKIPYEWHLPERSIRIFISDESNGALSISFPEFAVFRKQMAIPFYEVENGFIIYLYDLDGFTNASGEVVPGEVIRYILETQNGCVFENITEYES